MGGWKLILFAKILKVFLRRHLSLCTEAVCVFCSDHHHLTVCVYFKVPLRKCTLALWSLLAPFPPPRPTLPTLSPPLFKWLSHQKSTCTFTRNTQGRKTLQTLWAWVYVDVIVVVMISEQICCFSFEFVTEQLDKRSLNSATSSQDEYIQLFNPDEAPQINIFTISSIITVVPPLKGSLSNFKVKMTLNSE